VNMPQVTTVFDQQRVSLESALRQRLAAADASHPSQIFAADTNNIGRNLDNLRHAVERLPNESAVNPIRVRLNMLEQQFKESGALIKRVNGMDPQSLLKVQVQMYELTQNLELLSKVVEQVSSGVKTVLQTQVG
jgi:CII-binding regulator of phage lambda lysogenization HflD